MGTGGAGDRSQTTNEGAGGVNRTLLGLGVVLALAGLAFAAELAPPALGLQWWHVLVGGAVAGALGLRTLLDGARTPRRWTRTGAPERPDSVTTPGADVDQQLSSFTTTLSGNPTHRRRLRSRIREAAETVLVRFEGVAPDRATEMLDSGEWSDDPDVSTFVDALPRPMQLSPTERLRHAFSAESPYQRRARLVVEELGARAGLGRLALPTVRPPIGDPDPGDELPDPNGPGRIHLTNRWSGVGAVGLVALGIGIFVRSPAPLVVGLVGVGLAGYARVGSVPALELAVERTVSTTSPEPGDDVRVRLEITNTGTTLIPDLRVIDGVPAALAVTDGSPRLGVGLRPGKTATLEYTVRARIGRHEFDPVRVLGRDLPGAIERELALEHETTLRCRPTLHGGIAMPLRTHPSGVSGRIPTRSGGAGTEFHSTREYRRGDPVKRIDWHRLARTGELSTVLYRSETVATVIVLIDARAEAYRSPLDASVHAVDRSVIAMARAAGGLFDAGNRVGLAALGPRHVWLDPGVGHDHRRRFETTLAESEAFEARPPPEGFAPVRWVRRFRRRAPGDTQVLLVSPMLDDIPPLVVRWLEGYGYPVTVLSPNPTDDRTVGQFLARIERAGRLAGLREREVPVIDWAWDEPLAVAIDRLAHR